MTPEQCRAARGWVNWTQVDLAEKAKVGLSTVKEFELQYRTTRAENLRAMRDALERAGIRFIDHGGTLGVTFAKPSGNKRAGTSRERLNGAQDLRFSS